MMPRVSRRWQPLQLAGVGAWLLLVATACRPLSPAAPRPLTLPEVVGSILAMPPLDRAQWGILVYDPDARRVLYEHNPRLRLIPASNAKLGPTATALGVLGPEYRYVTRIHAPAAAADSMLPALVLVASGDPTWSTRFHPAPFAPLDSLADSLFLAGVRRVNGPLIIDASHFDDVLIPASWEYGDLNTTSAPPVAAFAVEEALVSIRIAPGGEVGAPAGVATQPRPELVPLVNQVVTGPPGSPARIAFSRRVGADTLIVSGVVSLGAEPETRSLPVPAPVQHAGRALLASLTARGIRIEQGLQVVFDTAAARALLPPGGFASPGGAATSADGGSAPRVGAVPLATWTSPPMSDIVAAILKPSQNWIAEQLVKTLGAERGARGSWNEGLAVQRRFFVEAALIDSTAFFFRDGSGLSVQNLLSPEAAVQLLDFARRQSWGEVFRSALPVAGVDGTLANRLQPVQGRVLAKTGTITHVNSLSGYAVTRDGRELVFSILSNASAQPAAAVREAIDRMAEAIAGY